MREKNEIIEIAVEDMSDAGEGIGHSDGFTWFVKDAVAGDLIEAKVMKCKKTYGYARLLRILSPSPDRVQPRCAAARRCGGCQLQALSYEAQLRFKEKKVLENLRRIGGFADILPAPGGETPAGEAFIPDTASLLPVLGMKDPWRYRGKALFPLGRDRDGRIITGFYAGRTHVIIEHEDCLLGAEENREILACIRAHMERHRIVPYDEKTHTGLVRHVLVRRGFRTGEIMVCLVINGRPKELPGRDELVRSLVALYPGTQKASPADEARPVPRVVSISLSINRERTNVIMGRELVNLHGPGFIRDFIGDVEYRISPLSFFQVNPAQTEVLYKRVQEFAALSGGETVWDLYCGIGTISLFLALQAGRVFGVEAVPEAVRDARENARLNGFENAEFFVGKAEEVLPEQYEKNHIHADVIVVDPPRKGCAKACLNTIIRMAPRRVVYVSCDSATLARDLKYLCANGFQLKKVQPVDQFPWTVHCEAVALCEHE